MTPASLSTHYKGYIACLNAKNWSELGRFVDAGVQHNGRPFGLAGYRAMLEKDFDTIPDLQFHIEIIVAEPPHVASRLRFDCSPKGSFLALPINGRRIRFTENVFYRFENEKIVQVWSVLDKAAIEAQLAAG